MKHSSFFITTLALCIFFCSPLYGKLPTPTIQNIINSSNRHNDDNDKTRNRIHNMHRDHHTHHLDPQDPYFNTKQQEYYIKLQNYIKQCEQRFNSTRIQVIDSTLQTCEHAVTLTLAPLEEQFSYTAGDLYIDLRQTYYDHIHCNDHSLTDELAHALNKLGNKVIKSCLTSKRFLARIYRIDASGVTFEILRPGEGLPHIKLETFDIRNIPEQYHFQANTPASVLIPLHEQPTNSNPHPDQPLTEQRVDALIETIENPGTVLTQKHTLSQRVCDLLKEHGFDPERFASSTGTPLEQQFYNEIQSIIDKAATISDNDLTELCKQYAHSACIVSDLAHQFNTQHDLEKTAVTLNLGHSIIDAAESYTAACAHGIVDGVYNAGAHAYNMVRHPVQTAQSYIESCTHVAQALHDFTTRVLYHNPANPQSQNSLIGRLSHECSELYTFCSDCAATIAQLPPEEIIYHTTAFAVELLASHKIASLVKSTVSVGKAHILDNPTGKKILTALHTSKQNVYKKLEVCVKKLKKPLEKNLDTILDTFESSPHIQGSFTTLEHAFEKFEQTPGFEHLIGNIIKDIDEAAYNCAKGAFYEIEAGLKMERCGEKILSFGKHIKDKEFDIETLTKLIECKNINWKFPTSKSLNKFKSDLCRGRGYALENKKIFELHSKTKIPDEWKEWLRNKDIIFYEESF